MTVRSIASVYHDVIQTVDKDLVSKTSRTRHFASRRTG